MFLYTSFQLQGDFKSKLETPLVSEKDMKFLGINDKYYYYLDLSKPTSNNSHRYLIPIVITLGPEYEDQQYQANIIVNTADNTVCVENEITNCKDLSQFKKYTVDSFAAEAINYIEDNSK